MTDYVDSCLLNVKFTTFCFQNIVINFAMNTAFLVMEIGSRQQKYILTYIYAQKRNTAKFIIVAHILILSPLKRYIYGHTLNENKVHGGHFP